MKGYFLIFFAILMVGCLTKKNSEVNFKGDIQPYSENPKYWQYKGKPVLLLGATNDDNLYQSPDVKEQLDLLQSVGGNFIRNTMSSRDSGDVWPFFHSDNGKYDLDRWSDEYWKRFENLLKLTNERDIIVQIEVWDRFDFSREEWKVNPFNAVNNINYSLEECGMDSVYPKHPSSDLQPFFHTIEGLPRYSPILELVKKYQEKYVDKILSYSLQYGNVLYCMNNETSTPPEWGLYWMNYIRIKAGEKSVYVTDMFDHFFEPNSCEKCKDAIKDVERYMFLDVSQINSRNFNQTHWETLQWIVNERNKYPARPINCTKVYGGNNSSWGSGSNDDGVERFCRDIMGGCASARHHRPNSGNGLNEKAQASIKAIRKVESLVKMWEAEAQTKPLYSITDSEAYLTKSGDGKYIVLLPEGGTAELNFGEDVKSFSGKWISIKNGDWGDEFSISGGGEVEITAPDGSGWFAVLTKSEN